MSLGRMYHLAWILSGVGFLGFTTLGGALGSVPIFLFGLALAVVAFVYAMYLSIVVIRNGDRRLLKRGIRGTATVLAAHQTNTIMQEGEFAWRAPYMWRYRLKVTLPAREPYETTCNICAVVAEGAQVEVVAAPHNHKRVTIDVGQGEADATDARPRTQLPRAEERSVRSDLTKSHEPVMESRYHFGLMKTARRSRRSLPALLAALAASLVLVALPAAQAATSPGLGLATSFGILASTYTNTAGGTTINGDLGYTTGPATNPTVNGTTYTPPNPTYTQAGIDQGTTLVALNSQGCDFTFPTGAVDLASDTTFSSPTGTYGPGRYCIIGAGSIGSGTITLSGSGTYIFSMTGALNTAANTTVLLANGATACDVWWTPVATTLGANSTFIGTDIDNAGITIGSTVSWTGRALAFAGTVSTATDTINVPSGCGTGGGSGGGGSSSGVPAVPVAAPPNLTG